MSEREQRRARLTEIVRRLAEMRLLAEQLGEGELAYRIGLALQEAEDELAAHDADKRH